MVLMSKKRESDPCFECQYGHYETELRPYSYYRLSFDKEPTAIIPDVPHEVCDECRDVCFSSDGSKVIENFIRNFNTPSAGPTTRRNRFEKIRGASTIQACRRD